MALFFGEVSKRLRIDNLCVPMFSFSFDARRYIILLKHLEARATSISIFGDVIVHGP